MLAGLDLGAFNLDVLFPEGRVPGEGLSGNELEQFYRREGPAVKRVADRLAGEVVTTHRLDGPFNDPEGRHLYGRDLDGHQRPGTPGMPQVREGL